MRERDWNSSPRLRRRYSLEQMMKNAAQGKTPSSQRLKDRLQDAPNDLIKSHSAQQPRVNSNDIPPPPPPQVSKKSSTPNTSIHRRMKMKRKRFRERKTDSKSKLSEKSNRHSNNNNNGKNKNRKRTQSNKPTTTNQRSVRFNPEKNRVHQYVPSNTSTISNAFRRNNNKKSVKSDNASPINPSSPNHRPHTQSSPMLPFSDSLLAVASPISVSDIPSKTDKIHGQDMEITGRGKRKRNNRNEKPSIVKHFGDFDINEHSRSTQYNIDTDRSDSDREDSLDSNTSSETPEYNKKHQYQQLSQSHNMIAQARRMTPISPNSPSMSISHSQSVSRSKKGARSAMNEKPVPLPIYRSGSHSYHKDNDRHITDTRHQHQNSNKYHSYSQRNISDLVANADRETPVDIDLYLRGRGASHSHSKESQSQSKSMTNSSSMRPASTKSMPLKAMKERENKQQQGISNMKMEDLERVLKEEIETQFQSKFDELKKMLLEKEQENAELKKKRKKKSKKKKSKKKKREQKKLAKLRRMEQKRRSISKDRAKKLKQSEDELKKLEQQRRDSPKVPRKKFNPRDHFKNLTNKTKTKKQNIIKDENDDEDEWEEYGNNDENNDKMSPKSSSGDSYSTFQANDTPKSTPHLSPNNKHSTDNHLAVDTDPFELNVDTMSNASDDYRKGSDLNITSNASNSHSDSDETYNRKYKNSKNKKKTTKDKEESEKSVWSEDDDDESVGDNGYKTEVSTNISLVSHSSMQSEDGLVTPTDHPLYGHKVSDASDFSEKDIKYTNQLQQIQGGQRRRWWGSMKQ